MTEAIAEPKPVALFDLTGTLVRSQIAFDWAAHLEGKKLLDPGMYRCILEWRGLYKDGALTYNEMTKNCVTDLYQGLVYATKDDIMAETEKFLGTINLGPYLYRASRAIYDMVAEKYERTIAVTGLPEELGIALKKIFPFTVVLGSLPDLLEGKKYVGRKPRLNVAKIDMKEEVITKYSETEPINWKKSFAAGNTEQDFPMLRMVSGHYEPNEKERTSYLKVAILFNAKPELRNIAQENGWYLVDSDAINEKYNILKVEKALKRLQLGV